MPSMTAPMIASMNDDDATTLSDVYMPKFDFSKVDEYEEATPTNEAKDIAAMQSRQVMDFHLRAWKMCGLWHKSDDPRWYSVYASFVWGSCFLIFPCFIALQLFFAESISEFIRILLILPTAMVAIKGVLVIINHSKLLTLFDLMDRMDAAVQLDEHRAIVQTQINGSQFLLYLLSGEYVCSMAANLLIALLSTDRALLFAMPRFWPFDYKNNDSMYYIVIGYQLVACSVIAFTSLSMDVYGLALYKILGAHVDVLGNKIAMVGHRSRIIEQNGRRRRLSKTVWKKLCEQDLNDCIGYHNLCIRYSEYINDILSIHYFVQFGMSGIIICGSEFRLFSIDPVEDFANYFLVVLYIVGMIFEILMPCYYGSKIKEKSEQLPTQMFSANWPEQSKEFKSCMLIFGERAIRPISPFAGGILALSLPTFVSTMKFAYSLLALLKEMENKE